MTLPQEIPEEQLKPVLEWIREELDIKMQMELDLLICGNSFSVPSRYPAHTIRFDPGQVTIRVEKDATTGQPRPVFCHPDWSGPGPIQHSMAFPPAPAFYGISPVQRMAEEAERNILLRQWTCAKWWNQQKRGKA